MRPRERREPCEPAVEPRRDAADGFLVNGSVNNGAASPFAQLAAFGNNRRGLRSLYNGGLGVILGNSAWDARPFSFASNQRTAKPDYSDIQFAGTFGGPLRIPGLLTNGPNLFVAYQRTSDHNANTQPALMPTALERGGDFSQTRDAFGTAGPDSSIRRPGCRSPAASFPRDRISPQAAALLALLPAAESRCRRPLQLSDAGHHRRAGRTASRRG